MVSFNCRGLEVLQLPNAELVARVLNRRREKMRPQHPEGLENFKLDMNHVPDIFTSDDDACCEITIGEFNDKAPVKYLFGYNQAVVKSL